MIIGQWKSPFTVVFSVVSAVAMIYFRYQNLNHKLPKLMIVGVLTAFILILPIFVVLSVSDYTSSAQTVATQKEITYFKKILDGTFDYKELIRWEWAHIGWLNSSEPNPQRNTDPIKIYEYGKGQCMEFAILYSALCVSQGYQCRIVTAPINDHTWTEVKLDGKWTRVDPSLNDTSGRAIGYPMFFEKEPGWTAPVIALAFEGSSIVDVTATYRSDHFSALTPITLFLIAVTFCGYFVLKMRERRKSVIEEAKESRID